MPFLVRPPTTERYRPLPLTKRGSVAYLLARVVVPVFCRTGSAHTTGDARKVLLALEPARHRHIQNAILGGTQHLLGAPYPAVQDKLVRTLAR